MDGEVASFQLRNALHEVLQNRQSEIDEIIPKHADSLKELYLMLEPRRRKAEDFPPIGEEDPLDQVLVEQGFQEWNERYKLGEGSSITSLKLPPLPPISPPATSTVFPDEPAATEQPIASTSSQSPLKPKSSSGVIPTEQSSDSIRSSIKSPITQKQFIPLLLSPSPPPEDDQPRIGVTMEEIQPRPRLLRTATSFAPPPKLDVPDWIPIDNYRPAELPGTSPKILMPLETDYTSQLPKLPPLPPQTRSNQSQSGPSKKKTKLNENIDLYKLQSLYKLNPLSEQLSKSSKCVLTNDWKIALNELRYIRSIERIDIKKSENRWSLRQPKKLKTLPIKKSHWDFLLEEMEWIKIDFNEELKWKKIQALEFAYQCVEWHLSNEQEKANLMVGNRGWGKSMNQLIPGHSGRIRIYEPEQAVSSDTEQEIPNASAEDDDVEMLVGREEDVPVEEGVAGAEVLETIEEMKVEQEQRKEDEVKKENEDVEMGQGADADAVGEEDADGEPDDGATADADGEEEDAEGEEDADGEAEDVGEDVVGLDDIDNADESDRDASEVRRDTVLPNGLVINKRFANVEELVAARKPLLDLSFTTTTIDLESLPQLSATSNVTDNTAEPQTPPSLIDLFPDLAVYQGPAPPIDEKASYRLDEGQTTGHRIAHTSRILDIRPILISTLQPAKNAPNGVWDIHEGPYFEDPKGSTDVSATVVAATSSVFYGRGIRPLDSMRPAEQPKPASQHLRAQLVWSSEEDEHLLKLVATYPFHWQLIADCFNSEIVTIPTEKRSAYECWERWYNNFGDGKEKLKKAAEVQAATSTAPTPNINPTTTVTPVIASTSTMVTPAPIPTSAPPSAIPPSTAASSRPGNQTPQTAPPQQTPNTGISVPSLPTATPQAPGSATTAQVPPTAGTTGTETPLPDGAPPPPGMSKRDRQAAKPKYEGSKKSIRHQAIYDAAKRMNRRREANKTKSGLKDQPKKVINVHESHASYLMSSISTPWELVETKYQRDLQAMQQRQQRAMQEQQRQMAMRQQMMQQQQQAAQQVQQPQVGQGQPQQQQQAIPQPQPGQPQPPQGQGQVQPIQPTPQPQQSQMRPPSTAPIRMGPNGQPMPNIAPSQQQLLNAVAAANAVNRQNVNGVPNQGNVRPLPPNPQQSQQQQQGQVGQQVQSPQVQQQMQLLQAQQIAAQQAQLRAAQQAQQAQIQTQGQGQGRINNNTPILQSGQLPTGSPYTQQNTPISIPAQINSNDNSGNNLIMNSSPSLTQSSPQNQSNIPQPQQQQQRIPSGNVPQHLRVASTSSQNSPQMSQSPIPIPQQLQQGVGVQGVPNQGVQAGQIPIQNPQINNAAMQQIIAQLAANGQQATPEQIRALMLRNAQMQAAAQAQAQVAAQAQAQAQNQGNPGTPQMGIQGVQNVQHFARSPSVQNAQIQARNIPKPNQG